MAKPLVSNLGTLTQGKGSSLAGLQATWAHAYITFSGQPNPEEWVTYFPVSWAWKPRKDP